MPWGRRDLPRRHRVRRRPARARPAHRHGTRTAPRCRCRFAHLCPGCPARLPVCLARRAHGWSSSDSSGSEGRRPRGDPHRGYRTDGFRDVGRSAPLTEKGHSKILIIEGAALIFILSMVIIASQFPGTLFFARSTPFEWIILTIWLGTIFLTTKFISKKKSTASLHKEIKGTLRLPKSKFKGTINAAIMVLIFGAITTLLAGWALEVSGEQLANRWGMSGVLFGATILALCTALPEISTGIASAKIRDYNMAVSDIFGGNAFLPVLFLMASLIGNDPILPNLKPSDIYLTVLGIILTGIYMIGMVLHSKKQILRMGIDSFIVVIVYLLGLWGLLSLV